jgi:hypothetical protein
MDLIVPEPLILRHSRPNSFQSSVSPMPPEPGPNSLQITAKPQNSHGNEPSNVPAPNDENGPARQMKACRVTRCVSSCRQPATQSPVPPTDSHNIYRRSILKRTVAHRRFAGQKRLCPTGQYVIRIQLRVRHPLIYFLARSRNQNCERRHNLHKQSRILAPIGTLPEAPAKNS